MRRWTAAIVSLALLAGGCSKSIEGDNAAPTAAEVKHEPASTNAAKEDRAAGETIKVSVPQIAYAYRYLFKMPGDAIAAMQDRHLQMCDELGPARCQVLGMQRAVGDSSSAEGSVTLMVEARAARGFGSALSRAVLQSGGEQSDSSIEAEDLSKQMVDTEARLRAKQALADRLMTLLKTRSGPVADLVAAEKAVADVQEEIDAAQSWLADARGRVAMSRLELGYQERSGGFLAPLRHSASGLAAFFGQSLGMLLTLFATLLPWAAAGGLIYWVVRYIRRRFRSAEETAG